MFYEGILQGTELKKIILIFAEIIFLAIAFSILGGILSYQVVAKIYIQDVPSEIPDRYKDSIYAALADSVLQNIDNTAQIKNNIAVARKGSISVQYDAETGRYDGSFIVDLAEIQQTYLVKAFWVEADVALHDEPISVQCPEKEDIIYDNFQCGNPHVRQITSILPVSIPIQSPLVDKVKQNYPESDIDSSMVTIILKESDKYSSKNKSLDYSVVACGDKEIISETSFIVKDWISSSGFNPDDYKLNFIDDCEDN